MEIDLIIAWLLSCITYAFLPDVGLSKAGIVMTLVVLTMTYTVVVFYVRRFLYKITGKECFYEGD